jgi:hypothetical protein
MRRAFSQCLTPKGFVGADHTTPIPTWSLFLHRGPSTHSCVCWPLCSTQTNSLLFACLCFPAAAINCSALHFLSFCLCADILSLCCVCMSVMLQLPQPTAPALPAAPAMAAGRQAAVVPWWDRPVQLHAPTVALSLRFAVCLALGEHPQAHARVSGGSHSRRFAEKEAHTDPCSSDESVMLAAPISGQNCCCTSRGVQACAHTDCILRVQWAASAKYVYAPG